jgi:uncharacterized repeat protein (TIGR01451 family)
MTFILNKYKNIAMFALTVVLGLFTVTAVANAANVSFNNDPLDRDTVCVYNASQPSANNGTSDCQTSLPWSSAGVTANPGDIIAVAIYYHNTGSDTATMARAKVTSPQNMPASTSHTISAQVSAGNGGASSGSVTISLPTAQTLTYIPNVEDADSTVWYDNNSAQNTIPAGADLTLFSGGMYLAGQNGQMNGTLNPGWNDQGTVRLRFKVGEVATPDPEPIVTTNNVGTTAVSGTVLNGSVNNFGNQSQVWFKYGINTSVLDTTLPYQSLGGTNGTQNFSATISDYLGQPLLENTTYYYQACAQYFGQPGMSCGSVETFVINQIVTPTYQCNDGIDNDGDNLVDSADPGCTSPTDNSEYNAVTPTVYQCNDGYDNDSDGYVDYPYDPGCSSYTDNTESPYNTPPTYTYQCNDGYDNDGDGYVDYPYDPGCSSSTDNDEYNYITPTTYQCNDGYDNDSDGYVDYPNDPGCSSYTDNTEAPYNGNTTYQCNDGIDNDADGFIDYPNDGGCSSTIDNSEIGGSIISNLDAITTAASSVGQTSAVINGLVMSGNTQISQVYFEYGTTTALGQTTSNVSVGASGTQSAVKALSGLSSNTTYFYRVVAVATNGAVDRGLIKFFKTNSVTVINPNPEPPVVIVENIDGAGSLFLALDIEADFENVVVGDSIDYTVMYRNIADTDLENVVIQVALAEQVRFLKSTRGVYSQPDHELTVIVGDLDEDEEGEFLVRVEVLRGAEGDLLVTQANAGHDHPSIRDAQVGTVPAYAINNVVNDPNRLVGLALFGGGFFPTTFLGWLVLLLVVIILVLLARKLYTDYDEKRHGTLNIN